MKLLFTTNVPSPYRVDFFNELGKLCDLTVTFEKHTSDERDKSWENYHFDNFKGVFLKGRSINTDTAVSFDIIKYVKDKSFDKIICADFCSPTGMIAIQYMKNHHIKYWLESDGGFAKDGRGFKEKLKKHFISGADGYFSTGIAHDKYYTTYGANPSKIHRYPFTSLCESDILKSVPTLKEKALLRDKLGMKEEKIVMSVGRFSYQGGYGKGFDILIKLALKMPDTGIYIIGDEPTEEFVKLKDENKADHVHFISQKSKQGLKEYYGAADLFILMTRGDVWGLVINEAMANGLPIITTDRCGAGLELIDNGNNGFVIPLENTDIIVGSVLLFLDDSKFCKTVSKNNLLKISNYTIEKSALAHCFLCEG